MGNLLLKSIKLQTIATLAFAALMATMDLPINITFKTCIEFAVQNRSLTTGSAKYSNEDYPDDAERIIQENYLQLIYWPISNYLLHYTSLQLRLLPLQYTLDNSPR